jgi:hypothetical protein
MARIAARLKLGYYPLVENEAKRIRQFLQFPNSCAAIDPCAGTGRALALIACDTGARLYGIELDAFRRNWCCSGPGSAFSLSPACACF